MALSKPVTTPVNMMDTFSALNNASNGATAANSMQNSVNTPPVQENRSQRPLERSMGPSGIQNQPQIQQNAEPARQTQPEAPKPVNSTEKTMISLRLLKKDKEKFQDFFKAHGLSFTDGLYMAADFIEKEVASGRLQMSKSGIQYK